MLADHWAELPLFADTEAALAALRSDGWRLGILTNCDTDLFESTRNAFPVQIDMVVTAEEVGNYKPDLAHFTEFERRSGVQRANWVHAAVSWFHDMAPARNSACGAYGSTASSPATTPPPSLHGSRT